MSSTLFVHKVTEVPAQWANDVNRLTYDIFGGAHTVVDARTRLGLTSLALQPPSSVALTGGSIEGVAIGLTNPHLGKFSNLELTQATNSSSHPLSVSTKGYVDTQILAAVSATSIGTLGTQNANTVNISGGNLNNVSIGSTTSAVYGRFSTLDIDTQGSSPSSAVRYGTIGTMALQNATTVAITGGTIAGVAGAFSSLTSAAVASSPTDVTTKSYVDTAISTSILAVTGGSPLGTMAFQNAASVAITGGSVTVGTLRTSTTPAISSDVANKSYVDTAISNLVNGAGAALDTLNELAAALGNDANFSTTVATALNNRVLLDGSNIPVHTIAAADATKVPTVAAIRSLGSDLLSTGAEGTAYRTSSTAITGSVSVLNKYVSFPALRSYTDLVAATASAAITLADSTDVLTADTTATVSFAVTVNAPNTYTRRVARRIAVYNGASKAVTISLSGCTFVDGSTTYIASNTVESVILVPTGNTGWAVF